MRWIALAAVAILAGCGQAPDGQASAESAEVAVNAEPAPSPAGPAPLKATQSAQAPTAAPAATAPLLAYTYTFGLELPARAVRPLLARHEAACVAAGPTVCQVTANTSESQGRDQVSATLELRARPDWLRRFRSGLEGDAQSAGGRVTGSGTETEDLTVAIVDTEAQLRAKSTLRTRLERLLAERPGKLEEVLQVETELARVQGEIDAGLSTLAVMRTRVNTSTLTVSYVSQGTPVQDGVFAPLADAGNGFLRHMIQAFAAMLTLLSWLLPFAILVGGLVWAALKLRGPVGSKTRRRSAAPKEPGQA
jgi:hypothetical protein